MKRHRERETERKRDQSVRHKRKNQRECECEEERGRDKKKDRERGEIKTEIYVFTNLGTLQSIHHPLWLNTAHTDTRSRGRSGGKDSGDGVNRRFTATDSTQQSRSLWQ